MVVGVVTELPRTLEVFIIALVLGQIVDNVVVPRVMIGLVGVNPIWLLVAVFLGAKLKGIMGILLAVPIARAIENIGDDLKVEQRLKQTETVRQQEVKNEQHIIAEQFNQTED